MSSQVIPLLWYVGYRSGGQTAFVGREIAAAIAHLLAIVACQALWLCLVIGPMDAHADSGAESLEMESRQVERMDFDIPSQSLGGALDQFAVVTGHSALFSSALVSNRTSSAIRGRYTPLQALQRMLQETGLELDQVATGDVSAFVLRKAAEPEVVTPVSEAMIRMYDGLLQQHILGALCADLRTAAPGYQVLIRFSVLKDGRLEGVRLLGSSGSSSRDKALRRALAGVRLAYQPPPGFRQPVTLLVLPEKAHDKSCAQEAA